jgi:ankyrin repeat protein
MPQEQKDGLVASAAEKPWEIQWRKKREVAAKRSMLAKLYQAARRDYLPGGERARLLLIQEALAAGVNVNAKGSRKNEGAGYRALHVAASGAHVDVIEALLRAGADPNGVATDGATPLHTAAHRSDAVAVELLLAWGAQVNALDKEGASPLEHSFMFSSITGRFDAAKALLAAGAQWPQGDTNRKTDPRWKALQNRDPVALEFMVQNGADFKVFFEGLTPWTLMARGHGTNWFLDEAKFVKCCDILDAVGAPIAEISTRYRAEDALCEAVFGRIAPVCLQRLARSVGDFSAMDAAREKRLRSQLGSSSADRLGEALALGLDPKKPWSDGAGLLSILSQEIGGSNYVTQPGSLKMAMEAGADPNAFDADGVRPLARALANDDGRSGLVQEMLDGGADPTLSAWRGGPSLFIYASQPRSMKIPNGDGNSRRYGVCRHLGDDMVRRMVALGGDVNEKFEGRPLLYCALRQQIQFSAALLIEQGARWDGVFEALSRESDAQYLQAMIPPSYDRARESQLPWEMRRWLDLGASPSALFAALGQAAQATLPGAQWQASPAMALLEAFALREQTVQATAEPVLRGAKVRL